MEGVGGPMRAHYKTVIKNGHAELVEKKSRFLATVSPVKTEEDARAAIETVKKTYYDARHHVFAYRIGENGAVTKYSDDGEPAGTAGLPILDILQKGGIEDAVIVVTRYFGGTLLGTGGLVRAYGRCAKEGVTDAGICDVTAYEQMELSVEYPLAGKVQYFLAQENYLTENTIYDTQVHFILLVEQERADGFLQDITALSDGRAKIQRTAIKYGAWHEGEFLDF